ATTDATATVTYYTSNTDAQLGQNAIQDPSAFQNTTPDQQEIWVRVETVYGCWDTDSFNLIVNPLPQADLTTPVFYACEETPGEGLFDLTEVTPVITSGQPGYSVAYYTDAATTQQIDESTPYLTSDATIYALVTDVVTGCNIVAAVSLDVQPAPIAPTPTPLEECDFNNDNVAAFNLQDALDEIQAAMGNG
ncbi:hypothetical protein ACLI1A_19550, partial [Flavobacterium sp. RHBU_3]|uniref:hypothetical protein n=1 Tax=Flavobacterium sp. RHBU_3 TaxID=3391184 RepID=UPI0039854654